MNINQTAFCSTVTLVSATAACYWASAMVVHSAAYLALGALTLALACVSVASISAWVEKARVGGSSKEYFQATYDHSVHVIFGGFQRVAQAMVYSMVFSGTYVIIKCLNAV
jgi:hypothetical protein